MAALRQQAIPGIGTEITFAVPEGQDLIAWYRAQVENYGLFTGDRIRAQQEAAWVLEVAYVIDALQKPTRLTWRDGQVVDSREGDIAGRTVVGRVLPPRIFETGYKVTNPATRFDWNPNRPPRGMSAAMVEVDHQRATMALAQLSILREVVTTVAAREVAAAAERSTGWIGAAVVAGSVVVAGAALAGYFRHLESVEELSSEMTARAEQARIAQAGQDFAARIAQLNTTGTMPPPSALETAVAAQVGQRAQSEWSNFWTGAERTVGKAGKIVVIVAALGLAASMASK